MLWVDASNAAIGVALEIGKDVVEDASWLRGKNNSSHINLGELDAALKGINLARKWGVKKLTLATDSAHCVWVVEVSHLPVP